MIDRVTAKARNAINLAVQAAQELGHSYVGTEHLLIGLLEEGSGVAARVLDENGVKAVSYTHLDVYKRQVRQLRASMEYSGTVDFGRCPVLW